MRAAARWRAEAGHRVTRPFRVADPIGGNSVRRTHRALAILGVVAVLAAVGSARDRPDRADTSAVSPAATSIVLVTLDGVRLREIFEGPDGALPGAAGHPSGSAMPRFATQLVPSGTFLGLPEAGGRMSLGNPAGVSLPSYQSLFVGRPTLCFSNGCAPPLTASLLDRVDARFGVDDRAIAMYATWGELCDGVGAHRVADAVCGRDAMQARWRTRFDSGSPDAGGAAVRHAPESGDEAAFELAMGRLRQGPPPLLYLALDDSDAFAHAGDYAGYLATLGRYDRWLAALDAEIRHLEAAGHRIALLVTTDHGRGRGADWTEHRWNVPGTGELWLFARGAGIRAAGAVAGDRVYTLHDVRPTIEHLLGLVPTTGPLRGRVIEALLAEPVTRRLADRTPDRSRG